MFTRRNICLKKLEDFSREIALTNETIIWRGKEAKISPLKHISKKVIPSEIAQKGNLKPANVTLPAFQLQQMFAICQGNEAQIWEFSGQPGFP